jgi:hypothetical protein
MAVFYVKARIAHPVSPAPKLDRVTLACVDCVNHPLAIAAIGQCVQKCAFARVLFVTDRELALDGVDVVRVPPITSRGAYSAFVVKDLAQYVDTSHVLLIQWDGFVVNPQSWSDEFLDYDYIGARWGWPTDSHTVGNGGFSLRSRKLLVAGGDPRIADMPIEDVAICRTYRPLLESQHGIRFAPEAVADRFAFEATYPNGMPFGFHGLFNFWLFFQKADLRAFVAMATPKILGSPQCLQLAKNLAELKRTDESLMVLSAIVAAHPGYGEAARLKRSLEDPATALLAAAAPKTVGRNDPCPCGSGKRYKLCHGAL